MEEIVVRLGRGTFIIRNRNFSSILQIKNICWLNLKIVSMLNSKFIPGLDDLGVEKNLTLAIRKPKHGDNIKNETRFQNFCNWIQDDKTNEEDIEIKKTELRKEMNHYIYHI